jgi:hypothetical protein
MSRRGPIGKDRIRNRYQATGRAARYPDPVPSSGATGLAPLPRIWRIPPWQPAALFLAVSALAALDIYGHPGTGVLAATAFLAVLLMCLGIAAARYLLVADEDGIWVRGLLAEHGVLWDDLRNVHIVDARRGATTVRLYRRDGTYVDVPPSLLLPGRPTKVEKARAMVHGVGAELEQYASVRRSG